MAEQSNLPTRTRIKSSAASISIVSNAMLVLLKLLIGFWGGSVSVLSEAIHSATDLMASSIAFFSVRASETPPDEEHPYGHGKIESLSGLAEALLIFCAAAAILYGAMVKLLHPRNEHTLGVDAGLGVMALSALVNFFLSRHLLRVAKKTDSLALEADAQHLRVDVLTSLGVVIGLALVRFTGQAWFDPLTALLVALLILRTAYTLLCSALHPLLDAHLPSEEVTAIRNVLESDARVLGYHKLRTRKSGAQRHADVHVQVDDDSTLVQAHALTEELEDRIRDRLPAIHIHIHTEPYRAEMRHQQEAHGMASASFPADRCAAAPQEPWPPSEAHAARPEDAQAESQSARPPRWSEPSSSPPRHVFPRQERKH